MIAFFNYNIPKSKIQKFLILSIIIFLKSKQRINELDISIIP
jgi:hypothetical protein